MDFTLQSLTPTLIMTEKDTCFMSLFIFLHRLAEPMEFPEELVVDSPLQVVTKCEASEPSPI